MRRAEIITAFILGLFSLYFMWKSGEPPSWNPDVGRFENIGFDDSGTPGSGFWPFWLGMIMFGCCLWIGVNWFLKKSPASKSTEPFLDEFGKKKSFSRLDWFAWLSRADSCSRVLRGNFCFFNLLHSVCWEAPLVNNLEHISGNTNTRIFLF